MCLNFARRDVSVPQVLRRHYSHQADIWSCGVILYILLSGVPPFWGESEQQIFDCILKGNLDFQSDPWPQISTEAKDCVRQMLTQVSCCCIRRRYSIPAGYNRHDGRCKA